jgi:hypothetical protein
LPVFLLCLSASPVWADYLGGITFETESPAFLPHGYMVNISIDYKVDEPEGARVFARPFTLGSPTPGYGASGGPLVGPGTGTTSQYFTINTGEAVVTHVRVYLVSPDQSETYLEIFVPVHYVFADHGIFNIRMDHGEYSRLPHDRDLNIDFDYSSEWTGNLRIFARPFTDGELTPYYAASGSASLPPTGSYSQYFSFDQDADVTDIRFQIYNDDQSQLLYEFFVPFDVHWRQIGIYDISVDRPKGEAMHNTQNLNVTFTVEHNDPENRYAWAWCTTGGSYTPDGGYQGGALVVPGTPTTVTRFCRVLSGEQMVDGIQLTFGLPNELMFDFIVPADYHYAPHVAQNHQFVPASPAILSLDEPLNMVFDYMTDNAEGVRIFGLPSYDGEYSVPQVSDGSPLYPSPSGSGDFWLTFIEGEHLTDAMHFRITNPDQSEWLSLHYVPGWWAWGTSGYITPAADSLPSLAAVLGAVYPNPFNPTATIPVEITRDTSLRLDVYDLRGRLVDRLHDGAISAGMHNFTFTGETLPSGVYFCRMKTPQGVSSRGMTLVK